MSDINADDDPTADWISVPDTTPCARKYEFIPDLIPQGLKKETGVAVEECEADETGIFSTQSDPTWRDENPNIAENVNAHSTAFSHFNVVSNQNNVDLAQPSPIIVKKEAETPVHSQFSGDLSATVPQQCDAIVEEPPPLIENIKNEPIEDEENSSSLSDIELPGSRAEKERLNGSHQPLSTDSPSNNDKTSGASKKCLSISPISNNQNRSGLKEVRVTLDTLPKKLKTLSNACRNNNIIERRRSSLTNHLKVHSNKNPSFSKPCPARFKHKYTQRHLENHATPKSRMAWHNNARPFTCDICSETFKTTDSLTEHLKVHSSDNNPFFCKPCPARFKRKYMLRRRVADQATRQLFRCNQCPRGFKSKNAVRRHVGKHLDKTRVTCPICLDTLMPASMKSHMKLRHRGDMPYSCDLCLEKFMKKRSLKNHRRRHFETGQYTCPVCARVFLTKSAERNHLIVHSDKSYFCDLCPAGYKRHKNFQCHLEEHAAGKLHSDSDERLVNELDACWHKDEGFESVAAKRVNDLEVCEHRGEKRLKRVTDRSMKDLDVCKHKDVEIVKTKTVTDTRNTNLTVYERKDERSVKPRAVTGNLDACEYKDRRNSKAKTVTEKRNSALAVSEHADVGSVNTNLKTLTNRGLCEQKSRRSSNTMTETDAHNADMTVCLYKDETSFKTDKRCEHEDEVKTKTMTDRHMKHLTPYAHKNEDSFKTITVPDMKQYSTPKYSVKLNDKSIRRESKSHDRPKSKSSSIPPKLHSISKEKQYSRMKRLAGLFGPTDLKAYRDDILDLCPYQSSNIVSVGVDNDEFPCDKCRVVFHKVDESICCDGGCYGRFHLRCVGLSEREFEMIIRLGGKVIWVCERCKGYKTTEVEELQKEKTRVEEELETMNVRLERLCTEYMEAQKTLESVKAEKRSLFVEKLELEDMKKVADKLHFGKMGAMMELKKANARIEGLQKENTKAKAELEHFKEEVKSLRREKWEVKMRSENKKEGVGSLSEKLKVESKKMKAELEKLRVRLEEKEVESAEREMEKENLKAEVERLHREKTEAIKELESVKATRRKFGDNILGVVGNVNLRRKSEDINRQSEKMQVERLCEEKNQLMRELESVKLKERKLTNKVLGIMGNVNLEQDCWQIKEKIFLSVQANKTSVDLIKHFERRGRPVVWLIGDDYNVVNQSVSEEVWKEGFICKGIIDDTKNATDWGLFITYSIESGSIVDGDVIVYCAGGQEVKRKEYEVLTRGIEDILKLVGTGIKFMFVTVRHRYDIDNIELNKSIHFCNAEVRKKVAAAGKGVYIDLSYLVRTDFDANGDKLSESGRRQFVCSIVTELRNIRSSDVARIGDTRGEIFGVNPPFPNQ